MSTAETKEWGEVLDRVSAWPTPLRIALAHRILDSLATPEASADAPNSRGRSAAGQPTPVVEPPPRKGSLRDLVGLLKTEGPPPSDEEVERIIEEERMRKYGG